MLKYYFLFLTTILFIQTAVAQKDTAVYYLTTAGRQVQNKGDGDFVVKILPPDPGGSPKLYIVDGYYKNGEKLFHTTSINASFPLKLQGIYTTFFQNGNKMSERKFANGEMTGESTMYFPNGGLYNKKSIQFTATDTLVLFQECRDTSGKILTTNGNGAWITYNDDFSRAIENGKVVNGLQDSVWTTTLRDDYSYKVKFKNGKKVLDSATGKILTFVSMVPEFPGGLDAFGHFLTNNLRYPATARENHIQGRVIISFIVEIDGALTNVKVAHGIGGGCDEEAMRVMKMSPKWKPAMQDGKPVRSMYNIPISFTLDN
jgi:TonB family protein